MNTEYNNKVICPYCDEEFDDWCDYGLQEDDDTAILKCSCGKKFNVIFHTSYSFCSLKIECNEKNESCEFELTPRYGINPCIYKDENWTIWKCTKCKKEKALDGSVMGDIPYILFPKNNI